MSVLIESDWNLKLLKASFSLAASFVLIESDWNLKVTATADGVIVVLVLIESDWNLKGQRRTDSCGCRTGINRIRLEFKG